MIVAAPALVALWAVKPSKHVAVADFQPGFGFGTETGILRQSAQHRVGMQNIIGSHFHLAVDYGVRADSAAGADSGAGFDYSKRSNADIFG